MAHSAMVGSMSRVRACLSFSGRNRSSMAGSGLENDRHLTQHCWSGRLDRSTLQLNDANDANYVTRRWGEQPELATRKFELRGRFI